MVNRERTKIQNRCPQNTIHKTDELATQTSPRIGINSNVPEVEEVSAPLVNSNVPEVE